MMIKTAINGHFMPLTGRVSDVFEHPDGAQGALVFARKY
jgi:hypothetical protein